MATARFDRDKLPKGTADWDALDNLSDEDVERRAESDPDAKPLTEDDLRKLEPSPRVRVIRMALGLSQQEFADTYGIPVATLRDWEQGRRQPDQAGDQASRTLLELIESLPVSLGELAEERTRQGLDKAGTRALLEALLVEGLESGEPIVVTKEYWERKRRELGDRQRRKS